MPLNVGQKGTSIVSQWSSGFSVPNEQSQKLLDLVFRGRVRFRFLRKEGTRRRIFEPYLVECPRLIRLPGEEELHPCGYHMVRRGGKEVCDHCLNEMPAVNEEDLVIDLNGMDIDQALSWVAPETQVTLEKDGIVFERYQHRLELKKDKWHFSSENRLGTRHWHGKGKASVKPTFELKEGGEVE